MTMFEQTRVQQSASANLTVDLDELRREAEESVRIEDAVWPPEWTPVVWSSRIVVALLDLAELGAAWARVEAALPEGWEFEGVILSDEPGKPWAASAVNKGDVHAFAEERAPTPTAALNALATALESARNEPWRNGR